MNLELEGLCADLEDGETRRVLCPVCSGGSSGEKSLSVTRKDGAFLYCCFRASCGASGAGGDRSMLRDTVVSATPVPVSTERPVEIAPLTEEWRLWLSERFGFNDSDIARGGIALAPAEGRVAYPIFSPLGLRRGYVLRNYDSLYQGPKALTRLQPDAENRLSWYWPGDNDGPWYVVEDIPSAIRVSRYRNCIALSGTGVTLSGISEMASNANDIIWALDEDATGQSILNMRKYSLHFKRSSCLFLPKDFKDMTDNELRTILGVTSGQ